jgi:ribosome-binding factor A
MPREFARSARVAQLVTRHLAVILRTEVKDPRVAALTITDVEVTKDLRQAKVFVSSMFNNESDIEGTMQALDNASGFLRRNLANTIEMRHCPSLVFVYDNSISHGAKMSALIDKALEQN